jgi:hypothetical protein
MRNIEYNAIRQKYNTKRQTEPSGKLKKMVFIKRVCSVNQAQMLALNGSPCYNISSKHLVTNCPYSLLQLMIFDINRCPWRFKSSLHSFPVMPDEGSRSSFQNVIF